MRKSHNFRGAGQQLSDIPQGIRASKMAFGGLKFQYPNTTAFVLCKHVNFLIVCLFISSYFSIYYYAPTTGEIDAFLAHAEKHHTIKLQCNGKDSCVSSLTQLSFPLHCNYIQSYGVHKLLVSDSRSRSSGDLITWHKYLGDCPRDLPAFPTKNPIF